MNRMRCLSFAAGLGLLASVLQSPATAGPPGCGVARARPHGGFLYAASIPVAAAAAVASAEASLPGFASGLTGRIPLLAPPIWAPPQRPVEDLREVVSTYVKDSWHVYTKPLDLRWRGALVVAGLAAVGGVLYAYDEDIYEELLRAKERDGYRWFHEYGEATEYVAHMGNMNRFYFGGLAAGYLLRLRPLTTLSAQILEAHFVSGAVKNVSGFTVGRERPEANLGPRHYDDGTSFPSGHTINVAELAVIFAHHVRFLPFQIFCYGTAVAISFQRVTSGAHWPSDVYAAYLLGHFTARELLKLHEQREIVLVPTTGPSGSLGLAVGWRF